MDVANLALALGSSLTAGLNLYITVLTLGLMQRFDILHLPSGLEPLSHTWVLATAAVLLVIEFAADKVPYLDSTWDAIHTFIRVPAGAVLAASALGDVPGPVLWGAALLGGTVAFTSHSAKASTRLAVNSTPEPFSNWFLSFAEDGLSLIVLWLVSNHPFLAVLVSAILICLFLAVIYFFYRFFRMIFRPRRVRPSADQFNRAHGVKGVQLK